MTNKESNRNSDNEHEQESNELDSSVIDCTDGENDTPFHTSQSTDSSPLLNCEFGNSLDSSVESLNQIGGVTSDTLNQVGASGGEVSVRDSEVVTGSVNESQSSTSGSAPTPDEPPLRAPQPGTGDSDNACVEDVIDDLAVDEHPVLIQLTQLVDAEPRTVLEVTEEIQESHNLSRNQVEYRLGKLAEYDVINSKKGAGKTSPQIFWRD